MRRCRQKKHYKKEGDLKEPREALWVSSTAEMVRSGIKEIPNLRQEHWSGPFNFSEGKVRDGELKLTKGVTISSEPKDVRLYSVREATLANAKIAAPDDDPEGWIPVEAGRFILTTPVPRTVRLEVVDQLTAGAVPSREGLSCVLVKNAVGEKAWVPESEVRAVEQASKRRINPPDRFTPGDDSGTQPRRRPQLRSRGVVQELVQEGDMTVLYEQVKQSAGGDSVIADPQSATERVMHLFRSSKGAANKDLVAASDALTLSLWYEAVRSENHVRVAAVDEALGAPHSNIVEFISQLGQPSSSGSDQSGSRPDVVDGSGQNSKAESSQKRSRSQDQNDQKKKRRVYKQCGDCHVRDARHCGSLCEVCFLLKNGSLERTLCRVCGPRGYKRVARVQGGRCSVCVKAKEGKKPKPRCVKCQSKTAHYRGKLCWTCSRQGKRDDFSASKKPAVGTVTRHTKPEHGPSTLVAPVALWQSVPLPSVPLPMPPE